MDEPKLSDICANCGQEYGLHSWRYKSCPGATVFRPKKKGA